MNIFKNLSLLAFFVSVGVSADALAVKSIFQYPRRIYCVNNNLLNSYQVLKETQGYIHSGVWGNEGKEALEVNETCASLIGQCQSKFGSEFVYVQSGYQLSPYWDTVKDSAGVICQHRWSDKH